MNLEFLPFSNAFLRNQTNRNSIKQLFLFHRQLKNISPDKSCLSLSTKIKMPSQQILPITQHPFPFPNPNSNPNPNSSNDMCCITVEHVDDDDRILLPPPSSLSFEDEKVMPIKPLLPRSSSYSSTSTTTSTTKGKKFYQQRRRRIPSDDSLLSLSADGDRLRSSGRDVEHAAADTFLLTRFGLKLFRYLGVGYRWIARFLALGCYALLLVPGFVQVGYKYFFSRHIRRGIVYGDKPRNRLDLYLPKNSDGPKPVIAFVTGGAWIIGYKAWGSLLGQQLSERDIIVACIDYRNFPRATMSDMIEDASQGIAFIVNHIAEYGGDPNRIYLMGQSAGAHIAACTLVEQAIKEAGEGESTSWSVSQIQAYFGLSGGYNLLELSDYFHSRGLYRSIFLRIMEGEQSLQRFSPEVMVQDPNIKSAVSLLPPIVLFHGTADYSIPSYSSKNFAETLQRHGVKAEAIMYEDRTHTDMFLQDPMRGDDKMFEDLLSIVHADDPAALAKDAAAPPRRRLVPECMLRLARRVSPF